MNEMFDQENLIFPINTTHKVVDLTDGDSNFVYQIDDKYLYKKFILSDQLKKEVVGMYLFSLLTNQEIPMLISQGNDYYISEFMVGSKSSYELLNKGVINKEQVNSVLAGFIGRTYWSYKFFDKSKISLFPFLKWESRLNCIAKEFTANKPYLLNHLSEKEYRKIKKVLKLVSADSSYREHITITHRDLHLENILVLNTGNYFKFYLIDFEHCMEGPVELEMQNSLLWSDEKSIDVEDIIYVLEHTYRIPYSKEKEKSLSAVYFADQLNLAIESGNIEKMDILVQKFRSKANI